MGREIAVLRTDAFLRVKILGLIISRAKFIGNIGSKKKYYSNYELYIILVRIFLQKKIMN